LTVLEGHLAVIEFGVWRADTAQGKLISSRKQIIRDTERFQINLSGKFDWWMEIWTSEKSGSKSVFREVGIGSKSGGI